MDTSILKQTVEQMTQPREGLLAADESTSTIGKRFDAINVENEEENRRAYRELLFTTEGMEQYISGVILYHETLYQKTADGMPFVELLQSKGVVPGIKVDTGMRPIVTEDGEQVTQGFDDLAERLAQYFEDGARFAKWRAAITIDPSKGWPSDLSVRLNTEGLARYAALCQQANIVPIVEPEVLMDGNFTMQQYAEVTMRVLQETFQRLEEFGVNTELMILKPNMIIPSSEGGETATAEQVAEQTFAVLKATVPASVPAIMFLSGGQTEEEATQNLAALNAIDGAPWVLSFSYGRALQQSALSAWEGKAENVAAAKQAFLVQSQRVSEAVK